MQTLMLKATHNIDGAFILMLDQCKFAVESCSAGNQCGVVLSVCVIDVVLGRCAFGYDLSRE